MVIDMTLSVDVAPVWINLWIMFAVVVAGVILYRVISGWVVRRKLRAASYPPVTGGQECIPSCQED
jgi:hypothetical protein